MTIVLASGVVAAAFARLRNEGIDSANAAVLAHMTANGHAIHPRFAAFTHEFMVIAASQTAAGPTEATPEGDALEVPKCENGNPEGQGDTEDETDNPENEEEAVNDERSDPDHVEPKERYDAQDPKERYDAQESSDQDPTEP